MASHQIDTQLLCTLFMSGGRFKNLKGPLVIEDKVRKKILLLSKIEGLIGPPGTSCTAGSDQVANLSEEDHNLVSDVDECLKFFTTKV